MSELALALESKKKDDEDRKDNENRESKEDEENSDEEEESFSLERRQEIINKFNSVIDEFVEMHSHGPKQKSEGWKQIRINGTEVVIMKGEKIETKRVYIGGSEISAATGTNEYKKTWQFVADKCGLAETDNGDTLPMMWGSLFEDIVARFIEIDLKTTVKGAEIMICGNRYFRYSPDGYIVAGLKQDKDGHWIVCDPYDPDCIPMIFLLEIKSPWMRKPKDIPVVPSYYEPQPMAGMEVSPFVSMALFIEAYFKRCGLHQLGHNKEYDRIVHKAWFLNMMPIAWGLTFVFCGEEEYEKFTKLYDYTTDFGCCSESCFRYVMKGIDSGTFDIINTDPRPYTPDEIDSLLAKYETISGQSYLLGYIPWKLFDLSYIPMPRQDNYIANISHTLDKINHIIHKVKQETKVVECTTEKKKIMYNIMTSEGIMYSYENPLNNSPIVEDNSSSFNIDQSDLDSFFNSIK